MKERIPSDIRQTRLLRCVSLLVALLFGVSAPAYAYLDPGTGSIILQGLLATIAAVIAAGGVFWQRVKSALSSLFSPRKAEEADPDLKH